MSMEERKKFYEAIKAKVGEGLSEEQIERIIDNLDFEDGSIPKIVVTSNPFEFEEDTRRFENRFNFGKEEYATRNTYGIIGDYIPGKDESYSLISEYSGEYETPFESHDDPYFVVNHVQAVLVKEDASDPVLVVYLPDEKQYPEQTSFKEIVLKERRRTLHEAIKAQVGEGLSEEQIHVIVDSFNLEDGSIPQIAVISDPYTFEESTRRYTDDFENGKLETRTTKVIIGDYKPGNDECYSEINDDSGEYEPSYGIHDSADFLVSEVQGVLVQENASDPVLVVYLPDEKQYSEPISFKDLQKGRMVPAKDVKFSATEIADDLLETSRSGLINSVQKDLTNIAINNIDYKKVEKMLPEEH